MQLVRYGLPVHTAHGLEKKPKTLYLAFLLGKWLLAKGMWNKVLENRNLIKPDGQWLMAIFR
jgi:hypothetical protein